MCTWRLESDFLCVCAVVGFCVGLCCSLILCGFVFGPPQDARRGWARLRRALPHLEYKVDESYPGEY